jgi:hypothetical protein
VLTVYLGALRRWLDRQDPSGESTFLTDPGFVRTS